MKIGVFSLIPWRFLDQRPQVFAKKFASWGHETLYFGTFPFTHYSDKEKDHNWEEYEARSWEVKKIAENLKVVHPLFLPAHKHFSEFFYRNEEFFKAIQEKILEEKIELGVVMDPIWGKVLSEINVPFIYDHVDDTHHMHHVLNDEFYFNGKFCEENSLFNIFIQKGVAERNRGIYIPNGITFEDLIYTPEEEKIYDAVCLSCIADWFDVDSVFSTKKNILLIGPMSPEIQAQYYEYKRLGGENLTWIPELPRRLATFWLNKAKVGIIPFDETHGIVDYVMPLKIVEYYYLGLPAVSYVNKGVIDEFGESHVHSYSSTGWLGYPSLDEAIENAAKDDRVDERREIAQKYSWDQVMSNLKDKLTSMGLKGL